jgi:probable addiction module antidote protein
LNCPIGAALGDTARTKGTTQIVCAARLGRENFYEALLPDDNPAVATIVKVINAVGLKLHASVTIATTV